MTDAQCIFWPIFVWFRIKLKIELLKKPIDILNYKANGAGVTKIIFFLYKQIKKNSKLWQIFEFFNFPRKLATKKEVYVSGHTFCCQSL
jgi:hypothetical protein